MATSVNTSEGVDVDTSAEEILLAATNHDLQTLKKLFETNDAKVQDPETGFSPLHAAIASCEADEELEEDGKVDGEGDALHGNALSEDAALATVHLLFENGAIWNELDNNDETPGCLALRLKLPKIYDSIVAAGVRAELLFSKLDDYQLLPDEPIDAEDKDADEDDDDAIVGFEPSPDRPNPDPRTASGSRDAHGDGANDIAGFEPAPNISQTSTTADASATPSARPAVARQIDRVAPMNGFEPRFTDVQANGTSTEAIDNAFEPKYTGTGTPPVLSNPNVNSEDYLRSNLTYSGDRLLDSDRNAVMMDWETEIMKTSADKLCPKPGLRTMNVGFGMGIVDSMFLANDPAEHHIVEAHPQVLARMREQGWFDKPNVRIHQGRWQEVLPKLVEQGVVLDAMYYDTYAEDYRDLKEFFDEYVIALLDSEGLFGFYNGLGADRQVCYDVYTKVVEIHLDEAGLDVEWTDIEVPDLAGRGEWTGVRRPYWASIDTYRLPTCKFVG